MSDRDDLAEAILGFAAVVSLVVESYERQDPEENNADRRPDFIAGFPRLPV